MNTYQLYNSTYASKEVIKLDKKLKTIDFDALNIFEYNLSYIKNMKPTLFYFLQIYDYTTNLLIGNQDIKDQWIIDFGGGHGFLSIYLKMRGFNVIYCDFNAKSVETAQKIKAEIGFGPDYFIEGSYQEIVDFVQTKQLDVHYLISTDTIEHVYDLNEMIGCFSQLNKQLKMIFTTASNPENAIKSRKLRQSMVKYELEENLPLRKRFLKENYPEFDEATIQDLAKNSRGYRYIDLPDFVNHYQSTNQFKQLSIDGYNTCEPKYGEWLERILPLEDYQKLAKKYSFDLQINNGFYCQIDKFGMKGKVVQMLNRFNLKNNKSGQFLAPFITLKYSRS